MISNDKTIQHEFSAFCSLIARLRDPEKGCPWDLKQTHETLAKHMIEEAYEACTALEGGKPKEICDELGDVLLQVVLNAQLGVDAGTFSIRDVISAIHNKIVRRHPHVFGSEEEQKRRELSQIMSRWQEIKEEENGAKAEDSVMKARGVYKTYPASVQAYKVGKVAHSVGFDWDEPGEVWEQVSREFRELQDEWEQAEKDLQKVHEEIGDLYFTLAQLCRHLGWEPELVAFKANQKFLSRFEKMEALSKGKPLAQLTKDEWEELWKSVKTS
ncbi:MAG: nucleoside triphosphate pyrophosphohydrolase [Deltaproteobacteria bacterium]|nr:nucleoside triphosphate pyrophosphohydrolase [Deltaproteobacteria bacterium]